ncbi:hypothetical protein INS49_014091 [Diaporthe citri]|uniref:uncharacterized protein n=1 Tax=Diaporthe citri TaxID=83186 RepID=UPI001C815FF4|nr:uncharacterized protein INS49_014091 [Diaporthe citri]KAG6358207.1 hypothetical protein INS49_014091 [Diaporthe citri]
MAADKVIPISASPSRTPSSTPGTTIASTTAAETMTRPIRVSLGRSMIALGTGPGGLPAGEAVMQDGEIWSIEQLCLAIDDLQDH